ncbi:hypothetical protein ThidrDRAFT_4041 [Thiorhodococcus drewsii AZ1]|uniref:Uncharacterized protein n=1 Tax=Thiorhodococcus drewsii AZ1 TaxID=765913 RepID=G2E6X8_9GAMM|nr:hypothetical protein [Thiorhodococcus drewsii]EGV28140.1 hypothetical protein ThidrDRAFT_4041 [Thiorhodococcus drewsii AZ1]
MPTSADPDQILSRLTAMTADRSPRPSAFIQANTEAILAALNAGYTGIDLYRALVEAGHPPPMSLRQFRRYLARLRPQPTVLPTPIPGSAPSPGSRHPASPPATLHWDPLADDEDIH